MILFKILNKKCLKDAVSQCQHFRVNFHKFHALYEIITVAIGCHKFCARWIPKMITGEHKIQRMASVLTFLERYHKDGGEFLNHVLRVTGDET
jgi:tRNA A37 methylthiotransferase MiaB